MAKSKAPKKIQAINSRSRASKRATSPSIDLDKSIKNIPRTNNTTSSGFVRQSGGIVKAKNKQKPKSRNQRLRREKGLARAESIQEQLSKKIDEAKSRNKKQQARKAIWEEINESDKQEQLLPSRQKTSIDNAEELNSQVLSDMQMIEEDNADRTGRAEAGTQFMNSIDALESEIGDKIVFVDKKTSSAHEDIENEEDKIT